MERKLSCPRCNNAMVPQRERLDLSWAGDGPNAADIDFVGILAEVHICPACGATAMRTAPLSLPLAAATAAA
ncbi:MAG: hypothetical protein ACM3SU_01740 [Acidobacteriota bacterium]